MAEFRKLFYALGAAALFTGLASTASAQSSVTCQASAVAPIIRGEGFTELVGDYTLDCFGGQKTAAGLPVPQVNITITVNAPITSRLLALGSTTGSWSEALLIVDEPNSSTNPDRPLLACGQTGAAPDNGPQGTNVCSIIAPDDATQTYNGLGGIAGDPAGPDQPCNGGDPDGNGAIPARPANNNSYGCGRPNVFQGRQALGQPNAIVFAGVPFNPPGTVDTGAQPHRILRFTNFRVAPQNFTSGGLVLPSITMSVNINSSMPITVINRDVAVASVASGISLISRGNPGSFVQCTAVSRPSNINVGNARPVVFREGFESSFKTKGLEQITGTSATDGVGNGNGVFSAGAWRLRAASAGTPYAYVASTTTLDAGGTRQNVPGAVYNTESGFTSFVDQVNYTSAGSPSAGQNPPFGFGYTFQVTGGTPLVNSTNIARAGIATQGTRIAIRFADLPRGITMSIPEIVYLYPEGSGPGTATPTGIAARTSAGARGDGLFSAVTDMIDGAFTNSTATSNLVVYEILFSQPNLKEDFYFPVNISYTPQLSSNLPDPTVTVIPTASGGFAPFIDLSTDSATVWGTAQFASATVGVAGLPIPRFRPLPTDKIDLFVIGKCACNLLFPFVTNFNTGRGNYDTGVAIANTSLSPTGATIAGSIYNSVGYLRGTAQQGPVQLWYFPADPATASQYATQCTNPAVDGICPGTKDVLPGGTLTFSVAAGNPAWGIAPRPGFTGYMIAQTSFQYCHAFAYISAQGAAPADPGMSVGYVALQLDTPNGQLSPARTNQGGEHLNQ